MYDNKFTRKRIKPRDSDLNLWLLKIGWIRANRTKEPQSMDISTGTCPTLKPQRVPCLLQPCKGLSWWRAAAPSTSEHSPTSHAAIIVQHSSLPLPDVQLSLWDSSSLTNVATHSLLSLQPFHSWDPSSLLLVGELLVHSCLSQWHY